jgi:hypothetical protein
VVLLVLAVSVVLAFKDQVGQVELVVQVARVVIKVLSEHKVPVDQAAHKAQVIKDQVVLQDQVEPVDLVVQVDPKVLLV